MYILHACYSCDGVAGVTTLSCTYQLRPPDRLTCESPSPIVCAADPPNWALSAVLTAIPAIGTFSRFSH